MIHALREEQRDVNPHEPLKKRGLVGCLSQRPNRVGIPKEGPTPCFEIQKNLGLRSREEGVKKVLSRETTGCSPSPYQALLKVSLWAKAQVVIWSK